MLLRIEHQELHFRPRSQGSDSTRRPLQQCSPCLTYWSVYENTPFYEKRPYQRQTATHCNTLQHTAMCWISLSTASLSLFSLMYAKTRLSTKRDRVKNTESLSLSAPEASWRRGFDPCTPLVLILYHYLEQNGCFWLVPEHAPGPSSQVLPSCWFRHPCYSKKLFVRTASLSLFALIHTKTRLSTKRHRVQDTESLSLLHLFHSSITCPFSGAVGWHIHVNMYTYMKTHLPMERKNSLPTRHTESLSLLIMNCVLFSGAIGIWPMNMDTHFSMFSMKRALSTWPTDSLSPTNHTLFYQVPFPAVQSASFR